MARSPFRSVKTSPEIIQIREMLYVRFPLSIRNVEDFFRERGICFARQACAFRAEFLIR